MLRSDYFARLLGGDFAEGRASSVVVRSSYPFQLERLIRYL